MKNRILITGSSGFIGFHVASFFLKKNYTVYGIDNHNDYYDTKLKIKRCNILKKSKHFVSLKKTFKTKSSPLC